MAHHNFGEETMSESIEMYLLRVALLQADDQPVPIPQLAQELAISPVSAHEMCRKLTDKGLVQYEPYKGVTLTTPGETLARRVLRCRRLWANFFGQKLGIEPQAADEMACRFEHVTPDELADRLAAYLDIPELASEDYQRQTCGLAQLTAGKRGRVVDLTADNVTNDFLKQQGIARGELITVLA
ncbi:MAG: metal-dependent transcriptional regulator, partial [Anaerolineae bacterium]|nr:metal-dependent transcriptional regulator [Anaerolineae bacterium]